ncbi:unnamed protein product [Closterium sp. Yama58-4]|nr:unnamed protein product [Closterium sp. Yama58-4]
MVLWMSSGSQHTAAVAPCSVQQLDLWQPAECGTSSTEDHISDEEVVEMASLLLQCESDFMGSLNVPRSNKDINFDSAEALPPPSQEFTRSPHRGNKRQREESASTGPALPDDQNRRILIQPCNVKIEDLLGPESSSLESLQETIEFQMDVAAFNDEVAIGAAAAAAATAAPAAAAAVRVKSEGEVDTLDGEVDEGFNGYIPTAAAERCGPQSSPPSPASSPSSPSSSPSSSSRLLVVPQLAPQPALLHIPQLACSATCQSARNAGAFIEPDVKRFKGQAAGDFYPRHQLSCAPSYTALSHAPSCAPSTPGCQPICAPSSGQASAMRVEPSCGEHATSAPKTRDLAETESLTVELISEHRGAMTTEPGEVYHANPEEASSNAAGGGWGSGLDFTSRQQQPPQLAPRREAAPDEGGNLYRCITGCDSPPPPPPPSRRCLTKPRRSSASSASHAATRGATRRPDMAAARGAAIRGAAASADSAAVPRATYSALRFGEPGYPAEYRGAFRDNVTALAADVMQREPEGYEVPAVLSLASPTHLLHGVIHSNGFGHLVTLNGRAAGSHVLSGRQLMQLWDNICTMLRARVVSVEDLSHKLSFSSDCRLLHTLTFSHSWFARWGYSFAHGAFGITHHRYSQAVARVAGTRLLPLLQHLRGINTGIASRVAAVVAKYQSHVLAKCQSEVEFQPRVSQGSQEVDQRYPHASHAPHSPHAAPHGPHAAPPNLTLQHLFSSLLALRSSLPLPLHHQHHHFPHLLHPSSLPLPFTPTTPSPLTAPSTPAAAAAAAAAAPLAAVPSLASSRSPLLSFSARRLVAPPPPLTLPPLFPSLQPMAVRQLSGEPSPSSASCLSDELSPRQQQQRLLCQQQQQALPSLVPPISYQQMDIPPSPSVATPSTITPSTIAPNTVTPRSKRTLLFLDSPISSALAAAPGAATPTTPAASAVAAAAAAAGEYPRRLLCNEPIIISPLPADSPSCRWSSKRLHLAQQVIVDVLSLRPGAWLPRHEVREAARQRIGDTGLLDFVLKSLGNRLVEDVVVRRAINPLSKVLEFSLEPLQREGGERGGGGRGEGREGVEREGVVGEEGRGGMEGQQGEVPMGEQAARAAVAAAGGDGGEERDGAATESEEEDGTIRVLCSIDARDADTNRDWPIPPPELITLPPEATVADLKSAACRAFAQTYPVARHMQVTALPEDLADLDEDDVLFGSLDSGASLLLAISSLDAHSEWRYEGGNDTWAVRCVCGALDDDGERMIACDECGVWQHTRCTGIGDAAPAPMSFLCLACRAGEKDHYREAPATQVRQAGSAARTCACRHSLCCAT